MRSISNAAVVTALFLFAACSPSELTETKVQEIRQNLIASRTAFTQAASTLTRSPIRRADNTSVQYLVGEKYQKENWKTAQLAPMLKVETQRFISGHHVKAVFVHKRRVNFVLYGVGLGVSGVSLGALVVPDEENDCQSFSERLELGGRGLRCEKISDGFYLYVDS